MTITVSGVVHGRRIDLDEEASLPNGAPVVVHIETRELSLEERRNIVVGTAGTWADDPSLDGVFDEIARGRRPNSEQRVTFKVGVIK